MRFSVYIHTYTQYFENNLSGALPCSEMHYTHKKPSAEKATPLSALDTKKK